MRKILALIALTALLLTGCTTNQTEAAPPKVETAAPLTVSPEPVTKVPTTTAPAEETKTAGAAPTSERGNLIKQVGEGAGWTEDGKTLAEFVVNSITVDPVCTAPYAEPSENGHLIALDVSIQTYPELAESLYPSFNLNPYMMKIVAPNGTTSNAELGTMASFSCLTDTVSLPAEGVGPAEKMTGSIVIDSEVPTGTLLITADGRNWWEYEF